MKYVFSILILFLGIGAPLIAQSAHTLKRAADEAYKKGDYQGSEETYRKAQIEKKSNNGTFNLGNSIYQQERYDEAARQYEDLANSPNASDAEKADAYYNLGNAMFNLQEFDKSVDAFKESLKLDPKDMETKYNLAQALRQLKVQQQEQQQQQQQDQEEQKDQEDQEDQEQQQQQQQQDQQKDQQDQQEPDDQQQQQQDLTKEEARQLLEIMEQEEKKVQEKMKKAQKGPNKSKKDW